MACIEKIVRAFDVFYARDGEYANSEGESENIHEESTCHYISTTYTTKLPNYKRGFYLETSTSFIRLGESLFIFVMQNATLCLLAVLLFI